MHLTETNISIHMKLTLKEILGAIFALIEIPALTCLFPGHQLMLHVYSKATGIVHLCRSCPLTSEH